MNRMKLSRFSKTAGIPVNQLDHVLVDQLIGADKDLKKTYKQLEALTKIREAAKVAGISLADVLAMINQL